ncbi:MAG: hypothetical protein AVDCRST_MAG08-98, partial [uncultured Acetobacteraceae bacterium]
DAADDRPAVPDPLLRPGRRALVRKAAAAMPAGFRVLRADARAAGHAEAAAPRFRAAPLRHHPGGPRPRVPAQERRAGPHGQALGFLARRPLRSRGHALLQRLPGVRALLGGRVRRPLHRELAHLLRRLRGQPFRLPQHLRPPAAGQPGLGELGFGAGPGPGGGNRAPPRRRLHAALPRQPAGHGNDGHGLPRRLGRPPGGVLGHHPRLPRLLTGGHRRRRRVRPPRQSPPLLHRRQAQRALRPAGARHGDGEAADVPPRQHARPALPPGEALQDLAGNQAGAVGVAGLAGRAAARTRRLAPRPRWGRAAGQAPGPPM